MECIFSDYFSLIYFIIKKKFNSRIDEYHIMRHSMNLESVNL